MLLRMIMLASVLYMGRCLAMDEETRAVPSVITTDAQALAYCKLTKESYVVIVWPRGFKHLAYITDTLNRYASIKYVKKWVCNKQQMFALYRQLHKDMSYAVAESNFRPYTSASAEQPLNLAALILYTKAPLQKLLSWKYAMREHIGAGFYSLHINDYYNPETVEAAQAVFAPVSRRALGAGCVSVRDMVFRLNH